jgi:3',5'-nucleoside bisphosphate phosphatase
VPAHVKAARRGWVIADEWIAERAEPRLGGIEVDHTDHDAAVRGGISMVVAGLSDGA